MLTEAQRREITLLLENPKYGSSDRVRDRARTRLKALGFIRFDRKAWCWRITPAGRAALQQEAGAENEGEDQPR